MDALIDVQSTPFSPVEQIKAELERVRKMPAGRSRDSVVKKMEAWLAERDKPEQG